MKIVLRQDVPKLGESGTVQSVADGYARNFLIPQGMAVVATAGEMKVSAHNQAVKERKIVKQEQLMQSLADRIDGQRLEFTARAGRTGRLYGSVTAGDIAERLAEAVGEEIDRRKLVLEDAVRSIGEHMVTVHLVGRLRPQVTVIVHGELDEEEEAKLQAENAARAEAAAAREAEEEADRETDASATEEDDDAGAEGHPEPGSGHDDSETVTAEEGPELDPIDGIPGAHGEVETRGGPITETNEAGEAVKVREEMDS